MGSLSLIRYALSSCVAAALLAGCGSSQPPIGTPGAMAQSISANIMLPSNPPERRVEPPDYNVSGPLLFVVNFNAPPYDGVTIYDAKQNNPSPIAVINADVNSSNGDCVDSDGTLYVGNDPGSSLGWVSEYALGKTTPLRVITQGINTPAFCAIDARGNLWVTNFGASNVTEYLKGSTVPYFSIKEGLTAPDGIAIDHAGNIYVGNFNAPYGKSNVQVYPPGKDSPSRTITDGVTWPIGLGVDTRGTLYVTNDVQCNIEEYRIGQSHPYQTITNAIDGPTAVTFAKTGRMFEVNEGIQNCPREGPTSVILEFRARALSPSKRTVSADLHTPAGVAYYPPLLP